MVDINWGLLNSGTNALQSFGQGMKIGQDLRERREADELKKAVTGYAMNPNDPNALAPVMAADPRLGLQLRGQQQQQIRQAQEQRRADLPLITRLVETSTDEATYQRNRAVAQEYGIDTSTLPPQFDPAWREQQLTTLRALQDPTKVEALSTAGKIAMDMGLRPGTPEFTQRVQEIWTANEAKPYVVGGETRLYQPKLGGPGQAVGPASPPPAAIAELKSNPASAAQFDEIFGQGASAQFLQQSGGQTARPSGTFRGSFSGLPGETVTSTYRDPAHNKRVGGVDNSYHTRRTADGKPMARDSVPPRGMSMSAYASQLRRLNPTLDVINEGDHVHMEPKG